MDYKNSKNMLNFKEFLNENYNSPKFASDEVVLKLDNSLHKEIEEYISDNIVEWSHGVEDAEYEEEAEALQFFGENERYVVYWRIYPDGTLNVVLRDQNKKSEKDWNYEWDFVDDEGEEVGGSNSFLDALSGHVSLEFDDSDTSGDNEFVLDYNIADKVREFFVKKKGAITGVKYGI